MGKATTIAPIKAIVASHPPTNAYDRRSPDGMPKSTRTASTDVGLESATPRPSSATEAISVSKHGDFTLPVTDGTPTTGERGRPGRSVEIELLVLRMDLGDNGVRLVGVSDEAPEAAAELAVARRE